MFLVYAPDARIARTVTAALPLDAECGALGAWSDFERAADGAGCLVVAATQGVDPELIAGIARIRARSPRQPVVGVAVRDADVVRALVPLGVDAVIWTGEIEALLWTTLCRVRARGLLDAAAQRLEAHPGPVPHLRTALCAALRSSEPVRSVEDLAAALGCHRTTLRHQWRRAFGPACEVAPSAFVDWTLLVRAYGEKRAGRKWSAVAEALGVHEHTLGRLSKRLLGCGLREFERLGRDTIAERFDRGLIARLSPRAIVLALTLPPGVAV